MNASTMTCSIDECGRPARVRMRALCNMHYLRWNRNGDPMRLLGVATGERNGSWRGDGVSYAGFHLRLMALRGAPSENDCAHCSSVAREWAYDHADPEEKIGRRGAPYSLSPEHYLPLCVSCHRRFDAFRRIRAAQAA